MKRKGFIFGAIVLIISGIICKVIGAVYKIPLISLMGAEGLGLFQLIFPIYSLFLVLATSGIAISLSKLISKQIANGNHQNVKVILKTALVLMIFLGILFCIVLFLLAPALSNIQNNANAKICYYAIAPSVIFTCIIIVFKGYFQGLQNMVPSAITQIIEQLIKLGASLLLVKLFLPLGLVYAVFGALLGVSISELAGLIFIVICFLFKRLKKTTTTITGTLTFKMAVKLLIYESLPIMLNAIIFPLTGAIDSLIIVFLMSKAGVGTSTAISLFGLNNGVVGSVISAPSVIAVAISTALLPSIISSYEKNDLQYCNEKSKIAIKLAWIFSLPFVIIFVLLSENIIRFLYSNGLKTIGINELKIASDLLKLNAISIVYVSFLSITTAILQAFNRSYEPVKNLLIASLLRFAILFLLVISPKINIYGLVIADISCLAIAVIMNISSIKKVLNINFDFKKFVFVPLISSAFMVGLIFLCYSSFYNLITDRLFTALLVFVGLIGYLIGIVLLKAFSKQELKLFFKINLKEKI